MTLLEFSFTRDILQKARTQSILLIVLSPERYPQ